jgi:outer membrane lipoprotein SlyB
VAVLGVAVLAMGAALIRTQNPTVDVRTAVLHVAMAASEVATLPVTQTASAATPQDASTAPLAGIQTTPAAPAVNAKAHATNVLVAKDKPTSTATTNAATEVVKPATGPRVVLPQNPEPAVARATAPARVTCATCGTVESVTAVEVEGAGSGAGAIAGGVLGAVVGNQVGGGDGKTLATILGAVGGGMAGNSVEKKMKKITQFDVTVRMEDGSRRTLRQATAPAVGSAVVVNGDSLQPATR